MDAATRQLVRQRANQRCEYCQLPQTAAPFFSFHMEHIRAKKHGGKDDPQNLALACPDCNRFKGTDLVTIDRETDQEVALFNPRVHTWDDHFVWDAAKIAGRTPIGRATVRLLKMNEEVRVKMREKLQARGEL